MIAQVAPSAESAPPSPPHLRPARFDDYEKIVRLEESAGYFEISAPNDWPAQWLGSPLWSRLGKNWPIGWVLETAAGEIVGSLGNLPLSYTFRGESVLVACGRAWIVAPAYRGFALWLVEEHNIQPSVSLLVNTSAGPMAFNTFNALWNRVPVGDWGTIPYRVVGYRSFATRALRKLHVPLAPVLAPPAGAALWLKDATFGKALSKARGSIVIETVDRFDSRFDTFWVELARQNRNTLMAKRDSATLSWHFAVPTRDRRLWIFTASKNNKLRAYCIVKRVGHTPDVRMRLVDYQSIDRDVDLLSPLLDAVLRRCVSERVSLLDKPGLGVAKMAVFDEFAPYRKKQSWSFFYRAVDSDLGAALREPGVWDPSEYDGDASIE